MKYEKCYKGEGHGTVDAHNRELKQGVGIREGFPEECMSGLRSGQRAGAFPGEGGRWWKARQSEETVCAKVLQWSGAWYVEDLKKGSVTETQRVGGGVGGDEQGGQQNQLANRPGWEF